MGSEKEEQFLPDEPLTRFASFGFTVFSGIAAVVTAVGTLYTSIFAPNTDLLQFLGFAAAILAVLAFGLAWIVVLTMKRVRVGRGKTFVSQHFFSQEDRSAARTKLLPLAGFLFVGAILLFIIDGCLTPKILSIVPSDSDDEVLVINGSRFGSDPSNVWVRFAEATTDEQVARKVGANVLEVVVPGKFSKGTISVRRGPRISDAVSFTYPGVIYETAVVRLIQPNEDPLAAIMGTIEPFPGFPYYSEVSDKPSQWPPRVFKDRSNFTVKIRQAFSGAAGQEAANWEERTPVTLSVSGGTDPDLKILQTYARLRMLLSDHKGDYNLISNQVGPHAAHALRILEDSRQALASDLPNRALILRVRNRSLEDAKDFTAELKVGGPVYDVTVNEEGEKAHSLEWSPDRINIDVPQLRPGYTTDIQVWYYYQPVSERVFADAADVEWEKTQGIVIVNLGISDGEIRRNPGLLTDLNPYERYPVDPLKGSPTFGQ